MKKYTEANKRLALALGWTNITEAAGALLGTPPDGAVGSRGQAMVPDWCGDWRECGPLLVRCGIEWYEFSVLARGVQYEKTCIASYADHGGDDDAAVKFAMCRVVADELEYAK